MMNGQVKRWLSIGCAIGGVSLYAAVSNAGGDAALNGAVGSFVKADQARRWTAAYERQNVGSVWAHYFGRDLLAQLLSSPEVAAISVRRAIDDRGQATVVLVTVDRQGRAREDDSGDASNPCPPCRPDEDPVQPSKNFSRTVGDPIPRATADRWAEAHRRSHPNALSEHVFGGELLTALLSRPGCEGLLMQRAIDEQGRPSLVIEPLDARGHRLPGDAAIPASAAGRWASSQR